MGLRGVSVRRFRLVICGQMGERRGQQAPGTVGSLWGRTAPGVLPQQHQCPRTSAPPTPCTPQTLSHNFRGLVGRDVYLETEYSSVF